MVLGWVLEKCVSGHLITHGSSLAGLRSKILHLSRFRANTLVVQWLVLPVIDPGGQGPIRGLPPYSGGSPSPGDIKKNRFRTVINRTRLISTMFIQQINHACNIVLRLLEKM
jgi:hypothetical protein